MDIRIEAISDRPDLAPMVARWKFDAFYFRPGLTVDALEALILAPPDGPEETFVLFDGDEPAGTAALTRSDLDTRTDLTPWLAGVLVLPPYRGRGHASTLVRRVEAAAVAAGVPVLWLYTSTAEGLYRRLGWDRVGLEREGDREVVLMRRDLLRQ